MIKKNHILFILVSVVSFSCDKKELYIGDEFPRVRYIDIEPAWSPDGRWIAFYHNDSISSKCGIYLVRPDGTNLKQWHAGFAATPAWSPDGEWITFSEYSQIWKKKLNGDSLTQLTNKGKNFYPSWSYNNESIIFDGWDPDFSNLRIYSIFTIKKNGQDKASIKSEHADGDIRMPVWNDSTLIIYVRHSPLFHETEIFSFDISTQSDIRLTFNDSRDYYPKILNNKIAFISILPSNPFFTIWTMNINGSGLKQITFQESYACDWSPGGNKLVYTDTREVNGWLWIMDSNGGNKQQLTYDYHYY